MQKSSVNKVILIGHIGNNPEGRYTPSGISTASFSIATNESWIDSDKVKKEHTEWHNIIAWNKLADFATQTKEKIDNSMISSIPFITMHESLGYLITKYSLSAAGNVYAYNLEDLEVTSAKYIEMLDVINDTKANFLVVEDNVAKKLADSIVDDTGITLITGMTVENMKSADQSYIDWIENNVSILVEGLSSK